MPGEDFRRVAAEADRVQRHRYDPTQELEDIEPARQGVLSEASNQELPSPSSAGEYCAELRVGVDGECCNRTADNRRQRYPCSGYVRSESQQRVEAGTHHSAYADGGRSHRGD